MGGGRRGAGLPIPPPVQGSRIDGKKVMRRLASETGGGYFEVSNKTSIEKIFAEIDDELRHQYSLGYVSNNGGESYRKIKLSVKRPGLIVQTRDGYYARN